jgi:hypothetical protein
VALSSSHVSRHFGRSIVTLGAIAPARKDPIGTSQAEAGIRHETHSPALGTRAAVSVIIIMMEYRGVEYAVVQGIGRQLWKWAASIDAKPLTGQAATKSEAVAEAERAIDRAMAPKKLRLVRP